MNPKTVYNMKFCCDKFYNNNSLLILKPNFEIILIMYAWEVMDQFNLTWWDTWCCILPRGRVADLSVMVSVGRLLYFIVSTLASASRLVCISWWFISCHALSSREITPCTPNYYRFSVPRRSALHLSRNHNSRRRLLFIHRKILSPTFVRIWKFKNLPSKNIYKTK